MSRRTPAGQQPQALRNAVTHDWHSARRTAFDGVAPLAACVVELADAIGCVLAEQLLALHDLPPFRTAAMDGWTVAGPGPWRLLAGAHLAGAPGENLPPGTARVIATGAALPSTADAVLRLEDGLVVDDMVSGQLRDGFDYLPRGGECTEGDLLIAAGVMLSPPAVGMAAACGYDRLSVFRRPLVATLVLGDELLERGLPGARRVRDSLGPQLPAWVRSMGGEPIPTRRVPDQLKATIDALRTAAAEADVVLTTGGTASGPVDHLHAALHALHADLCVDGVAARPGHPMLLALLPGGTPVVGLPGNPLSACVSALTLLAPVLERRAGRSLSSLRSAVLTSAVMANGEDCRLLPVFLAADGAVSPVSHVGSAMLRGLASADAVAVVPPSGADVGDRVDLLVLPWVNQP